MYVMSSQKEIVASFVRCLRLNSKEFGANTEGKRTVQRKKATPTKKVYTQHRIPSSLTKENQTIADPLLQIRKLPLVTMLDLW